MAITTKITGYNKNSMERIEVIVEFVDIANDFRQEKTYPIIISEVINKTNVQIKNGLDALIDVDKAEFEKLITLCQKLDIIIGN